MAGSSPSQHVSARSSRRRRVVAVITWIVIAWVVVFWRLGYPSLVDPDEAHYAELTREMVRARSWLVPLLDGSAYIDKPILFHWLQSMSVALFRESSFALRVPSALSALALCWTTRWLGSQLFDDEVGGWSGLMFATVPATFVLSRVGLFDMVFSAFLFGGVACLVVSALRHRKRLQDTGWVLLTLAVMTKGPVALLLVVLFFVAAALIGGDSRRALARLQWKVGFAFVIVVASPWFLWMWWVFGNDFMREYIVGGNLSYFTAPAIFSNRDSGYAFYLRTFAAGFFPWSVIAIGYVVDAIVRWRARVRLPAEEVLLWIWIVVLVAFFTIARFKLDTYIFPAAPACCLLAARGWQRAARDPTWRWTRVAVLVTAVMLIAGGCVAAAALVLIDLGLPWTAIVLPLTLVAGGSLLLRAMAVRDWQPPRRIAVPLVTLLVVYASVVVLGFPVLERVRPNPPLGRWLREHGDPEVPVVTYGLHKWLASIRYYADRPVVEIDEPKAEFGWPKDEAGRPRAVAAFLDRSPRGYVVMVDTDYETLRARGLAIREAYRLPVIVGSSGRFVRQQIWGDLVVVTSETRALANSPR